MSYLMNTGEIQQTIQMIDQQHLDVRTITMGISLLDCAGGSLSSCCDRIYDKICRQAKDLVKTGEAIWQARQKCPGLILLPPHHEKYSAMSKKIIS